MSVWRKVMLVAACMGLGALVLPPTYAAAKDAMQQVLISNGPDNPVPVNGSVAVSNDPSKPVPIDGSVAVSNDPSKPVPVSNDPSKPLSVNGSVAVTADPNSPLPVSGSVTVADNRQPFETRVDMFLDGGEPFGFFAFQVPAGKRLIVEFTSASVALPDGQTPLLSANASNGGLGFPYLLTKQGVGNGNAFFRGSTPVLDFAQSGFYVFGMERQNPGGGALTGTLSGFVYLSGYLLPVTPEAVAP